MLINAFTFLLLECYVIGIMLNEFKSMIKEEVRVLERIWTYRMWHLEVILERL